MTVGTLLCNVCVFFIYIEVPHVPQIHPMQHRLGSRRLSTFAVQVNFHLGKANTRAMAVAERSFRTGAAFVRAATYAVVFRELQGALPVSSWPTFHNRGL